MRTQDDGVVGKAHQYGFPFKAWLGHVLKPGVKDLMQEQVGQQWCRYTPNKVAKSLLEFSTSIARNQLRPSYGDGFLGAPIQIGLRQQTPTPPAQGDARGSSKPSTSKDAGDSHHI